MPTVKPSIATDIRRLKTVSRLMLSRLEAALREELPASKEEEEMRQKAHNRQFGVKSSLADTLAMLAELMLKLEAYQAADMPQASADHKLTEADQALVEAFIHKMRLAKAPQEAPHAPLVQ